MKKLIIYDFDKTIYTKDSTVEFYKFCFKKKNSIIKYIFIQIIYYILFKIFKKDEYKAKFFVFLKSFSKKEIENLVKEFWKIEGKNINKVVLNNYIKKGDEEKIVISASPEFLLEDIVKDCDINMLIATKFNLDTLEFESKNCYGVEKVKRLNELIRDNFEILEFYSDSYSDKPCADIAKKAYLIKNKKIYESDYIREKHIFKRILNIYLQYKEIINYLIVGIITMFITIFTYYILTLSLLNPKDNIQLQIANILSWIFAVIFAYIANRRYVFESTEKNILKECINFIFSRILTLFIDMFGMFLLVNIINANHNLSKIFVQVLIVVLNYVISKIIVFKKAGE